MRPAWSTFALALLIASFPVVPGNVVASQGGDDFGEVDESCQYTGSLGGPFPGLPPCTEGTKTEPLTCTNCVNSYFPERDENIEWANDSDCVRLVGKYMACGGPMTPFLVDDDDNVYFWAGRWKLHAIDKRGNLRWRFDLCEPFDDELCKRDPEECTGATRMVPRLSTRADPHGKMNLQTIFG